MKSTDARVNLADLLSRLPVVEETRTRNRRLRHFANASSGSNSRKAVVVDDDPTGTQTVHDTPVLTVWDTESLVAELKEPEPLFFILTNSRSLPSAEARAVNLEVGRSLHAASDRTGNAILVVSRSDSTLRGHYPDEVRALCAGLGYPELPHLIVPYFEAGGRITVDDVHYVIDGEWATPAGETEYARDAAFGYRSSNLTAWIEEKTSGAVRSCDVHSISIRDIRESVPDVVSRKLCAVPDNGVCIVNATHPADMSVLVDGLAAAFECGRPFIVRSAASIIPALVDMAKRPLVTSSELPGIADSAEAGGLVVAGSYVEKTSRQLAHLETQYNPAVVTLDATLAAMNGADPNEVRRCADLVNNALETGKLVLLQTSRNRVSGSGDKFLALCSNIADALNEVVKELRTRPRFIVAKGGITSSDIATKCLGIRRAVVAGQIVPGVPLWTCGSDSRFPGMPYVVFPGNVGSDASVTEAVTRLSRNPNDSQEIS